MSSPKGFYKYFDLGFKGTDNDMTDGDISTVVVAPGFAGKVVAIYVTTVTEATTATVAITKGTTLLTSAATIDCVGDTTAGTPLAVTLATANKTLEFAATDYFKAVWTLTDITAATTAGFACTIVCEPNTF